VPAAAIVVARPTLVATRIAIPVAVGITTDAPIFAGIAARLAPGPFAAVVGSRIASCPITAIFSACFTARLLAALVAARFAPGLFATLGQTAIAPPFSPCFGTRTCFATGVALARSLGAIPALSAGAAQIRAVVAATVPAVDLNRPAFASSAAEFTRILLAHTLACFAALALALLAGIPTIAAIALRAFLSIARLGFGGIGKGNEGHRSCKCPKRAALHQLGQCHGAYPLVSVLSRSTTRGLSM
jgi:hypothetical protein